MPNQRSKFCFGYPVDAFKISHSTRVNFKAVTSYQSLRKSRFSLRFNYKRGQIRFYLYIKQRYKLMARKIHKTVLILNLDLFMLKKTILGIIAAVAFGTVGMTTAQAGIVSSNTKFSFDSAVYELSLAGGAATYSFQNSMSAAPFVNAAIQTGGSALVGATFFGTSAFFTDSRAPFIDDALTFNSYASFKEINYSSTDSFLALAFNLADGVHYGYARVAGTEFLGYGYETVANVGIQAGAMASSSVPEPGSIALVMLALGLALTATARRRKN